MRCPECGAELVVGDKFCFSCGAAVDATARSENNVILKCSQCGGPVEEGDRFCSFCGKDQQKQKITGSDTIETTSATGDTNPHPFITSLGYANLLIWSIVLIIGGLALHSIPVSFMDDDMGFFMMIWAALGLLLGIGIFGGYLISRKQPLVKRRGKSIVFLSLCMIVIFLIALVAAFIRFE